MRSTVISFFFLLLGSLPGLLGRDFAVKSRGFSAIAHAIGCAFLIVLGLSGMNGETWSAVPCSIAYFGPVEIGLDNLSGTFLFILGVLGFSVCLFSKGYLKHLQIKWNYHWFPILFGVFIFSMAGLFLAKNTFMFLFFWELMALSSFGLVVVESLYESQRRTGFIYLSMTHVAAAFLFLSLLWPCAVGGKTFSISDWAQGLAAMGGISKFLVLMGLLIGFGTKAGLIPLHVWLPRAHPQAPSNVSALMSGVMIKTGIYGILRFMAAPEITAGIEWGVIMLVLGIVSAILGILYALNEHHLKSLLAYSSVENIGIICIAIGVGIIFREYGKTTESSLAFAAAIFHTLNHALFKGLLFMCAGAVQSSTHTGNLDELGGLAKTLPGVSVLFFIGAVSISGLPTTNGFASEWMVYRSLIAGFELPSIWFKVFMPIIAAMLALTGALAAGCFVKAFGTVFLGKPRSNYHFKEQPQDKIMMAGMVIPAFLCIFFGVIPESITGKTAYFGGGKAIDILKTTPLAWVNNTYDAVTPILVLSSLVAGILLGWLLLGGSRSKKPVDTVDTWNCSTILTERMSYSSSAFAEPFKVNFSFIFSPKRHIDDLGADAPYFPSRMTYHLSTRKIIEETFYKPLVKTVLRLSHGIQTLQAGSLHAYLTIMFAVLLVFLIFGR